MSGPMSLVRGGKGCCIPFADLNYFLCGLLLWF